MVSLMISTKSLGLPKWLSGKESVCHSLEEEMKTHSAFCSENHMDRRAHWLWDHGVAKNWILLQLHTSTNFLYSSPVKLVFPLSLGGD